MNLLMVDDADDKLIQILQSFQFYETMSFRMYFKSTIVF